MSKGFKVWDNTYDTKINPTNYPFGVEMPSNYATGKKINNKLIWRPVVIGTNPVFDSEIQERTSVYIIQNNQIIINYSVNDKPLNAYKKFRGRQFMQEGWRILLEKYPDDFDREGSAYITDRATLKNYVVNTLKPAIIAATTVKEVKNVTANWPAI